MTKHLPFIPAFLFFPGISEKTVILFPSTNVTAQSNITGQYRDYFGSRLLLNADSTFTYTWHFDMLSSWTKGTWTVAGDTVFFHMIPIYDTVSQTNSGGNPSDTLILSTDEVPERLTQSKYTGTFLSAGGQNRTAHPAKLLIRKGRLYKIKDGKLLVKKQKGFSTKKKWPPWFFYTGPIN
ncbi:MAG: hypothetical protein NTW29_14915 [Bacteroidetes bacterium]|nr:hypothetical protein [Bacteroidota bacterium]